MSERELFDLSASNGAQCAGCPGWSALTWYYRDKLERREKDYSILGTAGHSVLEHWIDEKKPPKKDYKLIEDDPGRTLIAVHFAYKTIKKFIKKYGGMYRSEGWVQIFPEFKFTGTIDFTLFAKTVLAVIDYKNGVGVPVVAKNNKQGIAYLFGAYEQLTPKQQKKITKFIFGVIQPRCERVEPVQYVEYTREQFFKKVKTLRKAVKVTYDLRAQAMVTNEPPPKKTLKKGDHCMFCEAKVLCPRWVEPVQRVVKQYKKDTKHDPDALPDMTQKKLEKLYADAIGVNSYITRLKEYLGARIAQGHGVGVLVQKPGAMRRTMNPSATKQLKRWLDKGKISKQQYNDCMKAPDLVNLTELNNILGADKLAKLVTPKRSAPSLGVSDGSPTREEQLKEKFKNG